MTPFAGRSIAWLSFALGIAVSVAGNIMHSAITPAGPGELVGAAFWPLALMLSIEILTRVRWQSGKRWMAARVLGLILVGTVAAVLSYRHLAGLMTSWGEDSFNAHLGPLAVDGLMLLAATALLSISREPKQSDPPEEWQGTPEEISAKAFDRGVAAQQIAEKVTGIPLREKPVSDDWVPESEVIRDAYAGAADLMGKVKAERNSQVYDPPVMAEDLLPKPASKPTSSKLHIVNSVSEDAAVEAARQAFFQHLDETGKPLPASKVAEMLDKPKSTVHRNYTTKWMNERRIVR